MPPKKMTMLCLGDSYTIGEAVAESERFPNQCRALLVKKNIMIAKPTIVARTGWTTGELLQAIEEWECEITFNVYDIVTLLIGVNNQYREGDLENYRTEFRALLSTALRYTGGEANKIFVLSIPDWSVTPFVSQDAKQRTAAAISEAIDRFNSVNKAETHSAHAHYIDITPYSRQAKNDISLLAEDGLHPSGKMYAYWAQLLAEEILKR